MKLSEAIMLNGMTKPQGHGNKSIRSIEAPCAIGGALQAIGKQADYEISPNYDRFIEAWPWTNDKWTVDCPECWHPTSPMHMIWHLNDKHLWTRQQIAEWVVRIEPEERLSFEDAWNDAQHCQAAISWSEVCND